MARLLARSPCSGLAGRSTSIDGRGASTGRESKAPDSMAAAQARSNAARTWLRSGAGIKGRVLRLAGWVSRPNRTGAATCLEYQGSQAGMVHARNSFIRRWAEADSPVGSRPPDSTGPRSTGRATIGPRLLGERTFRKPPGRKHSFIRGHCASARGPSHAVLAISHAPSPCTTPVVARHRLPYLGGAVRARHAFGVGRFGHTDLPAHRYRRRWQAR